MASKSAMNAISLDTNLTTIYAPGTSGACAAFTIFNASASSSNALINVSSMHVAGEYVGIPPGASMTFRHGTLQLGTITAKAVSTATISGGIAAIF